MNLSSLPPLQLLFDPIDIPSHPLTSPPKTPSTEGTTLQKGEISTSPSVNIHSILKSRSTRAEHNKRITFRQTNAIRLITKEHTIDTEVTEGKISEFFESHQATRRRLPRHKPSPFSRSPEDVKEIRAWLEFCGGCKKLNNNKLLKNYRRLVRKEEHVFNMRDQYFQGIVHECIKEYKQELKNRSLHPSSTANSLI